MTPDPSSMEGVHCIVERLPHPAHRLGTDPLPKKRREGNSHLPGGQTQKKTGKNEVVDFLDSSGIRGNHTPGAEAAGPGYRKSNVAEFRKDMTEVAPVPPVRNSFLVCPGEMVCNPFLHLVLQHLPYRLPVAASR